MDYPYVGKPLTSKIARYILLQQFAGQGAYSSTES